MTAFFERIAELPAIYDAARGADMLDSFDQGVSATSECLLPPPSSCATTPKVRELLAGGFVRRALSRRARPARSGPPRRLPAARSRRPSRTRRSAELAAAAEAAKTPKEVMAALAPLQAADRAARRARRSWRRLADGSGARGHERRRRRRASIRRSAFLFRTGARRRPDHRACRRGDATRLFRHRHGQARRASSSIIRATSTSSSSTTPTRAGLAPGRRAVSLLRAADARAGAPPPGAYRRRLCVPHRSAAPARSRARRRSRSRPMPGSPTTRASARTGSAPR